MDLSSQEVHLTHYWNVIQKRWKVAVSILLVVLLATLLVSYFQRPLYRTSIQIQIERENPNSLTIEDLFGIAASDQDFLQTQYVLLKSRGLGERVIEEHLLLRDRDFYPAGVDGKTPKEIRALTEGMAGSVLAAIDIVPVRNTSLVEIYATATSPRLAQKIAEGWGESYMRMNIEKKLNSVGQASEFLSERIAKLKIDLEATRQRMLEYGERKDIVAVDDPSNIWIQKINQLNSQLTQAQSSRIQKQAEYESLQRTAPEAVAANDPLVVRLTDDLSRMQRDYNEKLARLRPAHPEMVALADQIEKGRQAKQAAILSGYEKLKERARSEASSASAQESRLQNELNQQKRESGPLNASAMTYFDLRSAVETKQTLLVELEKQLSETQVAARLRGS
ncbi:MAG TPA: Wzz/FepE/Etk N-terminal domain-containing protein, partial [Thermoanaerobaculia bacterium]|nr:Wzz/FepE/Etk N-terminal domain-containing protein [Thermoanaerobaculia bacterium]